MGKIFCPLLTVVCYIEVPFMAGLTVYMYIWRLNFLTMNYSYLANNSTKKLETYSVLFYLYEIPAALWPYTPKEKKKLETLSLIVSVRDTRSCLTIYPQRKEKNYKLNSLMSVSAIQMPSYILIMYEFSWSYLSIVNCLYSAALLVVSIHC
jgi:hypothetical protein